MPNSSSVGKGGGAVKGILSTYRGSINIVTSWLAPIPSLDYYNRSAFVCQTAYVLTFSGLADRLV